MAMTTLDFMGAAGGVAGSKHPVTGAGACSAAQVARDGEHVELFGGAT
jgi:hypothetical protein